MQSSQRIVHNLALEYAISKANKLDKPLIVYFGLFSMFPEANQRHLKFLLEGLQEVEKSLKDLGVKLILWKISPENDVVSISKTSCMVIVDKGYLRILKQWYMDVASKLDCPLIQVEDNVVVPVELASKKEEYSAATLRPKIRKQRHFFLRSLKENQPKRISLDIEIESMNLTNIKALISTMNIDSSVKTCENFRGGSSEAERYLDLFLERKLAKYPERRNDPTEDVLSNMSPYLHYGQISPISIALRVLGSKVSQLAKEAYLEELIIRRELAINYAHYNNSYDSFNGLPNWTKITLKNHQTDSREYNYSIDQLEQAETHDSYWNAAQDEMRFTGKMHSYMRMYWGKKILEWSKKPELAFLNALYLNNKYELDGRDPNGFAGVAWCFGKHDRPWKERPIFGKVRYMNADGLRRKFNADKYVKIVKSLTS